MAVRAHAYKLKYTLPYQHSLVTSTVSPSGSSRLPTPVGTHSPTLFTLVDVVLVVFCTCLRLQFHPVCVVVGVVGVSAFHVSVLGVYDASLFVMAAWVCDVPDSALARVPGGPSARGVDGIVLCLDLFLLVCHCSVCCDPVVFVRKLLLIGWVECDQLHADRCCCRVGS